MTEIDHSMTPATLAPQVAAGKSLAASGDAGAPTDHITAITSLDTRTAAYVIASQPHFDRLRQAAGQLAGLLVLAASGAKSITPEHTVLSSAGVNYREAAGELRRIGVPDRAQGQHHHLLLAVDLIGLALRHCERDIAAYVLKSRNVTAALRPLQRGYAHLQRAAALLPGFEVVAFTQGCCASHPAVLSSYPHRLDHDKGTQR